MKIRIYIWIIAILFAWGFFLRWYLSVPSVLKMNDDISWNTVIKEVKEKYTIYKSQEFLLYWYGNDPIITPSRISFTDGVWLLRSLNTDGTLSFSWPKDMTGQIKEKGTVFLDFQNKIILSIDALIIKNNSKILPSFYLQNDKKMFYDLWDIEKIIDKDIWSLYKNNAIKDENELYAGFSDEEIINDINILLEREPTMENVGNTFFKKEVGARMILEEILNYMQNAKKQKKCWDNAGSCIRFITSNIQEGKKIDQGIFSKLEKPLIMWAKRNSNSNINLDYSWESIFQKYHLDTLSNNSEANIASAVNIRDNAILTMIQSSQNPTYEMWLYLTYILSKEDKWSSYSIKIMTEMIRLGELLKNNPENKETIVEESNRALSNLRKVLETTYFDKKDDYLFVLKENLKDDKGQKIDTMIFVNDLNQLISEIDKSSLFLEYPDFRILRRHLSWFTCIFLKNKEYLEDIRVCRGDL